MDAPVLIVGQGLAGSTLAWRLAERGVRAAVVDRGGVDHSGRPSASRVAAGLITPVTGKRLTVAEDYEALWASARTFYDRVGAATGRRVLDRRHAVRLFRDAEESERFAARSRDARFASHARPAEPNDLPAGVAAPHGAFVMPHAARLDVGAYLDATAEWLRREGRLRIADASPQELLEQSDARLVVLCQGHTPTPVRWLDGVRFAPAKGEVLTIEADTLTTDRVVHHGVWIAPCESGRAGRYRVGSTTEWNRVDSLPTAAGRNELLARLAAAGVRGFEVVDHQAAVRPATPDRRPTYGFSPAEPRIGWLNGLGAKGSLWAPFYAEQMARLVADRLGG